MKRNVSHCAALFVSCLVFARFAWSAFDSLSAGVVHSWSRAQLVGWIVYSCFWYPGPVWWALGCRHPGNKPLDESLVDIPCPLCSSRLGRSLIETLVRRHGGVSGSFINTRTGSSLDVWVSRSLFSTNECAGSPMSSVYLSHQPSRPLRSLWRHLLVQTFPRSSSTCVSSVSPRFVLCLLFPMFFPLTCDLEFSETNYSGIVFLIMICIYFILVIISCILKFVLFLLFVLFVLAESNVEMMWCKTERKSEIILFCVLKKHFHSLQTWFGDIKSHFTTYFCHWKWINFFPLDFLQVSFHSQALKIHYCAWKRLRPSSTRPFLSY